MSNDLEKVSLLSNISSIKSLILRSFAGIYLVAFLSFYIQCDGLFSNENGVQPAIVEPIRGKLLQDKLLAFIDRPSWIRVLKFVDVPTHPAIEVTALFGAFLSFFAFVSTRFCTTSIFVILWTLFFSLVDIVKDFHHQSDDLLLEAGLVVILLSPMWSKKYGIADNVMMMLMRWVLFRFLFTSGAVKLASGCPHWWSLNAIKHHMLTLPLPTNMAFYSYYLSDGWLKVTTIYVQLSELLIVWLFFAPLRSLRILAFYWFLFLQLTIIATGNFGYLNFMIIAMLFSLLDDAHFSFSLIKEQGVSFRKIFSFFATLSFLFFVIIITMRFYQITWTDGQLDAKILFSREEYMSVLRQMVKLSPFVATIAVINAFLQSCISHPNIATANGFFSKLSKIIHLLALTLVAISLIGCSTVPHGQLHPETQIMNTTIGKAYEDVFHKYHIVHEYGLHLRRMRSERLELSFQYSDAEKLDKSTPKQWKDFDVHYRPTNLNRSMPYIGPYFSRIDFRFYEATGKGAKLEKNFWLAGLMRNLLRNSRTALSLLGRENLMKMKKPPNFVRVSFMRVSFVPREDVDKNAGLYTRKILNNEYIPPMSLTSKELNDLLKNIKYSTKKEKEAYPQLIEALKQIRVFVEAFDGHVIVNSVLVASIMIMIRLRRY